MVRNYVRKTDRGKYGADILRLAMEKVRAGEMSQHQAAVAYGVPRTTLNRHLSRQLGCYGVHTW